MGCVNAECRMRNAELRQSVPRRLAASASLCLRQSAPSASKFFGGVCVSVSASICTVCAQICWRPLRLALQHNLVIHPAIHREAATIPPVVVAKIVTQRSFAGAAARSSR